MRAIVNTGPNRLELLDTPTPDPGPGQVRIRLLACGICATDLLMIAGWDRTGFPAIPGHEWSGMVDAAGPGVDRSLIGRRCVAENLLTDGGEVGFEHSGGYGEFLITEAANLQLLPQDYPPDCAALIEPVAVSVRAMKRLNARDKSGVLILGDGPIGLLMTALLKQSGFDRVFLVGGRPQRLELAREFGAPDVLNYHECNGPLSSAIASAYGGKFQNVVEASGNANALETAMEVAANEAKILLVGDYDQACANFPWNRILHREFELIGSNASAQAWPEAVQFALSNRALLERMVSLRVPVNEFDKGIQAVKTDRNLIKAVINWGAD